MLRPTQLSRYPITVQQAVALAAAAADDGPALVLLVFEEDGILVAVRDLDLAPAEIEAECDAVIRILADDVDRRADPVVVVSILPGFGSDPTPVVGTWHALCRRAADVGVPVLDWLLVDDRGVASMRGAVDPTTGNVRP